MVSTTNLQVLQPNETISTTILLDFENVNLPCGDYYYGILADAENSIAEGKESNNVSCIGMHTIEVDCETSKIGDVNLNGIVDILDAYSVSQYSVGLKVRSVCTSPMPSAQICFENADINNDGIVNILDAYQISRCAVGLSDSECSN